MFITPLPHAANCAWLPVLPIELLYLTRLTHIPLSYDPTTPPGRPLLVGTRPLQLWPLLLCKAILKVMAVYRLLDCGLPHQVPLQYVCSTFAVPCLLLTSQSSGSCAAGVCSQPPPFHPAPSFLPFRMLTGRCLSA